MTEKAQLHLPQIPPNLAVAYLTASQLDSTMKMIQEQAAVIARGIAIAAPIIEQHQKMAQAMMQIVNSPYFQESLAHVATALNIARRQVAVQADLFGMGSSQVGTLGLDEVVEEARQAQEAFAGTDLESDLAALLSEEDRAGIDRQVAFLNLADPATKKLLSWYVGIVIGLLYVVLILNMSDAVERYSAVLQAVGMPSAVAVTKITAHEARKLLDGKFPTPDAED